MSKFNLIDFIPFIIIGLFVFSLILGPTLLWPKYQTLKEYQNNINLKRMEIEEQEQYFANIASVKTRLDQNSEIVAKIDSALPDSIDIPALLNFIKLSCSQSGLVLESISPFSIKAVSGMTNVKEISMDLKVSGSYAAMKNFLFVIEKSARLIEIQDISFSSPASSQDLFTFALKIKVYSY